MELELALELYLIRHGIAAERGNYSEDADRPLTVAGQHKTQAVAERLRQLDCGWDALWSSPLVRACQTAEILQAAGLVERWAIDPALSPDRPIEPWLAHLDRWRQAHPTPPPNRPSHRLALVGHEPTLSQWAMQLLGLPSAIENAPSPVNEVLNETRNTIVLKKAGIIGLILPPVGSPLGRSQLFWLTPPRLFL
ncbi:MAG: phosphohistidine phosphatase SixA [Oscillatoriales cyanobacterium]|nr:MAG: phosphohistidine phosphatase SixA [Oscillatoriales cyanobacterium]